MADTFELDMPKILANRLVTGPYTFPVSRVMLILMPLALACWPHSRCCPSRPCWDPHLNMSPGAEMDSQVIARPIRHRRLSLELALGLGYL